MGPQLYLYRLFKENNMILTRSKKSFLFTVVLLAGVLCAPQAQAASITKDNPLVLKFTSPLMPTHAIIKDAVQPWADALKEKSDGRLVVEIYNPNTVCPEAEIYDCVKNGVVDIGLQIAQRISGKFPLENGLDMPFMYDSSAMAGYADWRLYEEFPELRQEFAETKMLAVWGSAPAQFHSASREVKSIADLKGAKMGVVTTSLVPILQSLGIAAFSIPATDGYMALQRGQVDFMACPYAFMVSTKMYEATKYSFTVNLSTPSGIIVMNKELLAMLPEELQQVITDTTGAPFSLHIGKVTDQSVVEDLVLMQAHGQIVKAFPPEEIAKGRELTRQVVEDWIKDCERRGLTSARALYQRMGELAAEYAQLSQ